MGCHFLLQGNLPNPEVKPMFLATTAWQVDSSPLAPPGRHVTPEPISIFPLPSQNLIKLIETNFCLSHQLSFLYNRLFTLAKSLLIRQQFMYHGSLYPPPLLLLLACKSAQSCPISCDPTDCSPPGFSVHRIFQATILE